MLSLCVYVSFNNKQMILVNPGTLLKGYMEQLYQETIVPNNKIGWDWVNTFMTHPSYNNDCLILSNLTGIHIQIFVVNSVPALYFH